MGDESPGRVGDVDLGAEVDVGVAARAGAQPPLSRAAPTDGRVIVPSVVKDSVPAATSASASVTVRLWSDGSVSLS